MTTTNPQVTGTPHDDPYATNQTSPNKSYDTTSFNRQVYDNPNYCNNTATSYLSDAYEVPPTMPLNPPTYDEIIQLQDQMYPKEEDSKLDSMARGAMHTSGSGEDPIQPPIEEDDHAYEVIPAVVLKTMDGGREAQ